MKQGKNAEIYRSGAIFLGKDKEKKKYKKNGHCHIKTIMAKLYVV
jgi:hypothetical protein